ncbi:MAG: beta-galactosidase [Chitinophagaceae bacterium]
MKASHVKIKKFKRRITVLFSLVLCILFSSGVNRNAEAITDNPGVIGNRDTSVGPNNLAPVFPYGAVYFRKSNPPSDDWEKDYKTAAGLGVNIMRHWFMWSVIEVAPGKYDWSDYDRQLDLATKNGIKTIIGEISNSAPEWMAKQYPEGRLLSGTNIWSIPRMNGSSATGDIIMCLDNPNVFREMEKFQTAMIMRYRNHPSLLGYDLWNEGSMPHCYCEATQVKFREWLKAKYSTLDNLGKAWHRYSFARWENVSPPYSSGGGAGVRGTGGDGYPDAMDWEEFRLAKKDRLFRHRAELFRNLDKKHLITAHKGGQASLDADEWSSAAAVDIWGLTWVASRHGDAPWMQFEAIDIVRGQAREKPFWHAEAEAGSLWMQPQVTGRPREDGRITYEKDVSLWNMISMAAGAKGILYPRWRPLLDGPLFGAFGPMGMDGSVTPKAERAGKVAHWANANPKLWQSGPVKGDIAIAFVPETQLFDLSASSQYYAESVRGAYQAFFDSNIQVDFVHIDNVKEYPIIYLPYAVMLKQETANKLLKYVENGGQLICEGLPGYWGDGGHVGEVQPNLGLDKLFGARQKYVEFTPDLLDTLKLQVRGSKIDGRYFLQQYSAEGGNIVGTFSNGSPAAVENKFGRGKTLLIGSFPGGGYARHHSAETRKFFAGLLEWGNVSQRVISSDPEVKVRLHEGVGGKYLWVVNATRTSREVTIRLSDKVKVSQAGKDLWSGKSASLNNNEIKITVDDRDAAVIPLQ